MPQHQLPDSRRKQGATGCVVHLEQSGSGIRVCCGNVGDTEAIMASASAPNATLLTQKHNMDQALERQRVVDSGGAPGADSGCGLRRTRSSAHPDSWPRVGFISTDNRVAGVLAITRCFGDTALNPIVTPCPSIANVTLPADAEFLLIACDGLWDTIRYAAVARSSRRTVAH